MATEFKLPDLGENIASGDVVTVFVSEGDVVKPGQPLLEVETDKAVIEVPCPPGGLVEKVLVKKGDTVKVGETLVLLGSAADPPAKPSVPPVVEPVSQPVAEPVRSAPPAVGNGQRPATPAGGSGGSRDGRRTGRSRCAAAGAGTRRRSRPCGGEWSGRPHHSRRRDCCRAKRQRSLPVGSAGWSRKHRTGRLGADPP